MYIDTHAHIIPSFYDDITSAVTAILQSQTKTVINIGTNIQESKEVLSLQDQYPTLFKSSIGLHPELAASKTEEELTNDFSLLTILAQNNRNKLSALGECGLDYKWVDEANVEGTKEKQYMLLEKHLQLAEELDLPIVIHCRGALEDFYEILLKRGKKEYTGVLHSVDGELDIVTKLMDLGFLVSFNGIMTFKNAKKIQQLAKEIPMDKILLETDSPFLTPTPLRGQKNSPSYMNYIYAFLAELKEMPTEKVIEIVNANAQRLFNL